MNMCLLCLLLFSFLLFSFSFVATIPHNIVPGILQHVNNYQSHGVYSLGDRAPTDHIHEFIIAIKQRNLDVLKNALDEISDMNSPRYGEHWTFDQVGETVRNDVAFEVVSRWLKENDITIVTSSHFGEYITAKAPIHKLEHVFATDFHAFHYNKESQSDDFIKRAPDIVYRALSYSLPSDIVPHVFSIFRLTTMPAEISHHAKFERVEDNGNGTIRNYGNVPYVTPAFLKSAYNIVGTGNGLGSQRIYGALQQTFLPSDITLLQNEFSLPDHPVDNLIGNIPNNAVCNNPQTSSYCDEASLDLEYILAVANTVPTTYFYDSSNDNDFVTFITDTSNEANPDFVISISYGTYEYQLSDSIIASFETEAIKLGIRGVTILASAGDDGVTGFNYRQSSYSLSNCGYYASWPASSQYVVAVGGTMNGPQLTGSPEIACSTVAYGGGQGSIITTGGGFSNLIPAPSFQANAVSNYIINTATSPAVQSSVKPYNTLNRAYPDLSMPANRYYVYIAGNVYAVSGTSASAPALAGLVSLANANRISNGLPTLGYILPSVYLNNGGFTNDIIYGDNKCTGSYPTIRCCSIGFTATTGWDPVTGFGTVDYAKFASFFANGKTYSPTISPAPSSFPSITKSINPTSSPTIFIPLYSITSFLQILFYVPQINVSNADLLKNSPLSSSQLLNNFQIIIEVDPFFPTSSITLSLQNSINLLLSIPNPKTHYVFTNISISITKNIVGDPNVYANEFYSHVFQQVNTSIYNHVLSNLLSSNSSTSIIRGLHLNIESKTTLQLTKPIVIRLSPNPTSSLNDDDSNSFYSSTSFIILIVIVGSFLIAMNLLIIYMCYNKRRNTISPNTNEYKTRPSRNISPTINRIRPDNSALNQYRMTYSTQVPSAQVIQARTIPQPSNISRQPLGTRNTISSPPLQSSSRASSSIYTLTADSNFMTTSDLSRGGQQTSYPSTNVLIGGQQTPYPSTNVLIGGQQTPYTSTNVLRGEQQTPYTSTNVLRGEQQTPYTSTNVQRGEQQTPYTSNTNNNIPSSGQQTPYTADRNQRMIVTPIKSSNSSLNSNSYSVPLENTLQVNVIRAKTRGSL